MLYHNCRQKYKAKMLEDCLIRSLSHPAQAMTLCCLRGKLVSAGSFENIIKLFMQRVWPLTITLLSEAGRGVCVRVRVCIAVFVCIKERVRVERGDSEAQAK